MGEPPTQKVGIRATKKGSSRGIGLSTTQRRHAAKIQMIDVPERGGSSSGSTRAICDADDWRWQLACLLTVPRAFHRVVAGGVISVAFRTAQGSLLGTLRDSPTYTYPELYLWRSSTGFGLAA